MLRWNWVARMSSPPAAHSSPCIVAAAAKNAVRITLREPSTMIAVGGPREMTAWP